VRESCSAAPTACADRGESGRLPMRALSSHEKRHSHRRPARAACRPPPDPSVAEVSMITGSSMSQRFGECTGFSTSTPTAGRLDVDISDAFRVPIFPAQLTFALQPPKCKDSCLCQSIDLKWSGQLMCILPLIQSTYCSASWNACCFAYDRFDAECGAHVAAPRVVGANITNNQNVRSPLPIWRAVLARDLRARPTTHDRDEFTRVSATPSTSVHLAPRARPIHAARVVHANRSSQPATRWPCQVGPSRTNAHSGLRARSRSAAQVWWNTGTPASSHSK